MSDISDNYLALKRFGLSENEAKLFLFLVERGFVTALFMSRELHIARTKIYRLLDKLLEKGLVIQKLEDRGMQFGPTSLTKFQEILQSKESEVSLIKQSLPELLTQLHQLSQTNTSSSKVLYYKGIEGLKQITYNMTQAKDLVRVYEVEHLSDFLPKDFSEDMRKRLVANKTMTHDLTNKKSFGDFTEVTEMIESYSKFRYIDPSLLTIQFESLIYDDIYTTYTYKDGEIFCIEIHNPHLAQMQKQIYDFIWNQAQPMQFTSLKGAARIGK